MYDTLFAGKYRGSQTSGIGAGKAANIKNCELCARKIAEVSDTAKVVVEKSTVPVRTAEAVRRVLATNDRKVEFQVRAAAAFERVGVVMVKPSGEHARRLVLASCVLAVAY